ncbi:hypothetical protein BJV74DRAFT_796161 [Russula compacta]|nr:hypothetical protein BJV74DRAFT_796161 [Russula compacta]
MTVNPWKVRDPPSASSLDIACFPIVASERLSTEMGIEAEEQVLLAPATRTIIHCASGVSNVDQAVWSSSDGNATMIVRRPLSNRTMSADTGAPLSVELKPSAPKSPAAEPGRSILRPHKASFGFIRGGAPRTPEERERLRKERVAFFRRARAHQRKNLPDLKLPRPPTFANDAPYTREYVGQTTGFHRIISRPALLAPPATNYGGQVLDPDAFAILPEIREHTPPLWDEWCPTPRPEHEKGIDASMLFVPQTSSSGDLHPHDLARYFPMLWRKVLAEHWHTREVRVNKKRSSKTRARSGRRRFHIRSLHFLRPRVDIRPYVVPATATYGGCQRHYGTTGLRMGGLPPSPRSIGLKPTAEGPVALSVSHAILNYSRTPFIDTVPGSLWISIQVCSAKLKHLSFVQTSVPWPKGRTWMLEGLVLEHLLGHSRAEECTQADGCALTAEKPVLACYWDLHELSYGMTQDVFGLGRIRKAPKPVPVRLHEDSSLAKEFGIDQSMRESRCTGFAGERVHSGRGCTSLFVRPVAPGRTAGPLESGLELLNLQESQRATGSDVIGVTFVGAGVHPGRGCDFPLARSAPQCARIISIKYLRLWHLEAYERPPALWKVEYAQAEAGARRAPDAISSSSPPEQIFLSIHAARGVVCPGRGHCTSLSVSVMFNSSAVEVIREYGRGGIAGEGAHVGRAYVLTSAVSTRRVLSIHPQKGRLAIPAYECTLADGLCSDVGCLVMVKLKRFKACIILYSK